MARPKQEEMPIEGPGVSTPRVAAIDRLADKLEEILDQKSDLASQVTKTEGKIIELMEENGLKKYKYRDREVIYKPGKIHVKLKTVKAEGKAPNTATDAEPPTE